MRVATMAPINRTETIDNMFTTTWRNVRRMLVDEVLQITPFFDTMLKNGRIRTEDVGGRFIDIPVAYDKCDQNMKFFGRGDSFGRAEREFMTQISYPMRYLGDSIMRFWEDDRKNRGPAQLLDYALQKINAHKAAMVDKLESSAFTADSSGIGFYSLPELIADDPTTGTIAEHNRATYAWMRNQTKAFTGVIAVDLIPQMRTMWNDCSKWAGGTRRSPDVIFTTQSVYEKLEEIGESMQTIETSNSISVSLGLGEMKYKGVPVQWAPSLTAGHMYFLNTEHLEMVVDAAAYFDMGEWKELTDSRDRVTQIYTALQLVCSNFRKQGVIHSIA